MVRAALCSLYLLLGSCVSTYVVFDRSWDKKAKPAYTDYFDSYFGGFVGHESVNLSRVCMDQKILAVRRYKSWEDGFLTGITLGIYAPTTVSVWCGD